jgi:hypothetical protein
MYFHAGSLLLLFCLLYVQTVTVGLLANYETAGANRKGFTD